ncbi:NAD(P)/FAD-dependent oxidoreductase [Streptomyces nigrescens]|uniref:FAD-dependent oxidoreductase n=2 Tax=Streptomyces nigrescens TaxID=1920 RepID=A0A640TWL0_STRNI|nr:MULTISPECIES: FAD-dependent oxidoreductase [Streptomyces]MCX5444269.1 FAD-dependent oxidoreductase [Streptomyces libani]WAU01327.1 FAD-dependent oxidoreductase [Streptomyces libani subsp. libani]WAU09191.1 FAD-dependent oxidoreductase [Streptomyces nigrescens]GFE27242.1 pyridine nucleotide-disulfide oxidoreductase [Streptomyces libani subsp. libani]GGV96676.1 pyridine nucleotide-disulfide oxidoreductase [Streptomyces libani subsp. libani]
MRGEVRDGRIVIVGASLAGLRAAETLREKGFTGSLTLVGEEPQPPYDRPPLSKQVLLGRVPADRTGLPRRRDVEAQWRLGVRATGLDPIGKRVLLADGEEVPFDRLLIATGTRARPWPNPAEAALDGVFTLRTSDEARRLAERLDAGPRRVLVIGAGFTGSEIASACRERGLAVTVAERGPAPLVGALGGTLGALAAKLQRAHGVDLRCGVTVTALEGDGRLTGAQFSDGTHIDADVAVVALGAIRNTEWLAESGLAAGPRGVTCDAGCRAFDMYGIVTDDVFAAGDIARFPHPLFEYQLLSLEHWGNAVAQAEVAAHNMVNPGPRRLPHLTVPAFWSSQFGLNIKSVGVPTFSDQVVIAQGSLKDARLVAVYGYRGRVTAAVSVNQARSLAYYQRLIETAAPFPPAPGAADQIESPVPVPSDVPDPKLLSHGPTVALTGHMPDRRLTVVQPAR